MLEWSDCVCLGSLDDCIQGFQLLVGGAIPLIDAPEHMDHIGLDFLEDLLLRSERSLKNIEKYEYKNGAPSGAPHVVRSKYLLFGVLLQPGVHPYDTKSSTPKGAG